MATDPATSAHEATEGPAFTIVTLASAPDFALGHIRCLRPRWAFEELGLPYGVHMVGWKELKSLEYRDLQPFNQVPVLEEAGRPPIFESGAILLAIAERCGGLLPEDPDDRSQALSWLFAALNSVEPVLMTLADIDMFTQDPAERAARRPRALKAATDRLALMEEQVAGRTTLAGTFSIADILMTTVLRNADHTDLVTSLPGLGAYKAANEARPAFRLALASQYADTKEMKLG